VIFDMDPTKVAEHFQAELARDDSWNTYYASVSKPEVVSMDVFEKFCKDVRDILSHSQFNDRIEGVYARLYAGSNTNDEPIRIELVMSTP